MRRLTAIEADTEQFVAQGGPLFEAGMDPEIARFKDHAEIGDEFPPGMVSLPSGWTTAWWPPVR
jgi:hypothetical protein